MFHFTTLVCIRFAVSFALPSICARCRFPLPVKGDAGMRNRRERGFVVGEKGIDNARLLHFVVAPLRSVPLQRPARHQRSVRSSDFGEQIHIAQKTNPSCWGVSVETKTETNHFSLALAKRAIGRTVALPAQLTKPYDESTRSCLMLRLLCSFLHTRISRTRTQHYSVR